MLLVSDRRLTLLVFKQRDLGAGSLSFGCSTHVLQHNFDWTRFPISNIDFFIVKCKTKKNQLTSSSMSHRIHPWIPIWCVALCSHSRIPRLQQTSCEYSECHRWNLFNIYFFCFFEQHLQTIPFLFPPAQPLNCQHFIEFLYEYYVAYCFHFYNLQFCISGFLILCFFHIISLTVFAFVIELVWFSVEFGEAQI